MEELLVLSLLIRSPMSGADLVTAVNGWLGPHQRVGAVTLHRLLVRLEEEDLITWPEAGDDPEPGGVFQITEYGQNRFYELMLDPWLERADQRQSFRLKVAHFDLLDQHERVELLSYYRRYCERILDHLGSEREQLIWTAGTQPGFETGRLQRGLEALSHAARCWEAEIRWADDLRRREEAGLAVAR